MRPLVVERRWARLTEDSGCAFGLQPPFDDSALIKTLGRDGLGNLFRRADRAVRDLIGSVTSRAADQLSPLSAPTP